MSDGQIGPRQDMKEIMDYIAERIRADADPDSIIADLGARGVPEQRARSLISMVARRMGEDVYAAGPASTREAPGAPGQATILPAIIGGGVAAVIGGLIWGGIAIATGYEIGWVAWGVGILAGLGVMASSPGVRGTLHNFISVGAAMCGIIIGKYLWFYRYYKDYVLENEGPEAAARIEIVSLDTAAEMAYTLHAMIGFIDVIFFGLAIYTAWKMIDLNQPRPG